MGKKSKPTRIIKISIHDLCMRRALLDRESLDRESGNKVTA